MTNEELKEKLRKEYAYDGKSKQWQYGFDACLKELQSAIAEATKEMWTDEDLLDAFEQGKDFQNIPDKYYDFEQWLKLKKQFKNNQSNTANVQYPTA